MRRLSLVLALALCSGCDYDPFGPTAAPAPPPAPAAPAAPPQMETVKAQSGVGKQGRGYGGGIITEPIRQRFVAEQKIIFEIAIPQAMLLYKATEGRAPRSHEEFMEVIIQANQIKLPELPDGESYIYDPKTEQLMVQRPVREGETPTGGDPAQPPADEPGGSALPGVPSLPKLPIGGAP